MQFRQKRKKIHLNPALGPPRYNGHLVITATFLLPGKTAIRVKQKPSLIRSPVNVANFFLPIGERINRAPLYCKRRFT